MIRVLLIAGPRLERQGLRCLVDREPEMTVIGDAASLDDAIALAAAQPPDVVVVDYRPTAHDGNELLALLSSQLPKARLVLIVRAGPGDVILRALETLARAVVMDEDGFEEISRAIRTAAEGGSYYSRSLVDRISPCDGGADTSPHNGSSDRLRKLTPRELEMLKLLARGHSLKEACDMLHVSYKTADKHKVNLMKKLDIHDRVCLARFAIRNRLVEP